MYQHDEEDPFEPDWDEPDDYRRRSARHRVRDYVIKVVALIIIVGLLLAFPLGYLLDQELRNQHLEAGLALIEVTIAVVLIAAVRISRKRL